MAEMEGSIGTVTVSVEVDLKPSEQFDAVAKMLGYVKKRTCRIEYTEHEEPFGFKFARARCDGCHHQLNATENYCPNCGARVIN